MDAILENVRSKYGIAQRQAFDPTRNKCDLKAEQAIIKRLNQYENGLGESIWKNYQTHSFGRDHNKLAPGIKLLSDHFKEVQDNQMRLGISIAGMALVGLPLIGLTATTLGFIAVSSAMLSPLAVIGLGLTASALLAPAISKFVGDVRYGLMDYNISKEMTDNHIETATRGVVNKVDEWERQEPLRKDQPLLLADKKAFSPMFEMR